MLPELVAGTTPEAADLRYDWGRTLAELIDEHYLTPLNTWAREHHTQFRSQSYGTPAVTLSSNALVDLPEGEGSQWHGGFSFTRWATSASHVYGRPITSSETWTWLHSPLVPRHAARYEGRGRHVFPAGNQSARRPRLALFAALGRRSRLVVLRGRGLQRSQSLVDGDAGCDELPVAHELPAAPGHAGQRYCRASCRKRMAQARFRPGHVSVTDEMRSLLGPDLVPAILDAGYNFDFIDSAAIDRVGIKYPVLVMPSVERLPLATYRQIQEFARAAVW